MPELELLPAGLIAAACWQLLSWHGNTIERAARRKGTLMPAQRPPGVSITVRDYIN